MRVHVGDGRDADAWRLDDVDGVDADARTNLARRRGVVPLYVGRDDGGDDATVPGPDAVALPTSRGQYKRDTPGSANRASERGLLLRVDRVRKAAFPLGVALAAPKISVAEMIQQGLNTMKQTLESIPAGG